MQNKIGIIGIGRLGKALTMALQEAGQPPVALCDYDATAYGFAQKLNIPFSTCPQELIQQATTVFLTVPDMKIAQVAAAIAPSCAGRTIFHCSGSLGCEALDPLCNIECERGCFHPLQAFTGDKISFQGVYAAVDGTPQALTTAEHIAHTLGAQTFFVPAAERALYHAAACILSNYTVTLSAVAEQLFAHWKIPKNAFMPLLKGSVQNIAAADTAASALTGPIVRGDLATVAKHLAVLPPQYLQMYRELGALTCAVAALEQPRLQVQYHNIEELLKNTKDG